MKKVFADLQHELTFISDNGGVISHHGERINQSLLDPDAYQAMIDFTEKTDGVAILCGLDAAYVAKKHQQHAHLL